MFVWNFLETVARYTKDDATTTGGTPMLSMLIVFILVVGALSLLIFIIYKVIKKIRSKSKNNKKEF
ncbi:MAG: hypothetical protein PPFGHCPK_00700 [Spiroplasma endosymbiont of Drosophila atripex]|nr:MAG: hypothetical protein PPFGHCPK_00700 [Spiroplasma endosymbiont of Drosophila atripex]